MRAMMSLPALALALFACEGGPGGPGPEPVPSEPQAAARAPAPDLRTRAEGIEREAPPARGVTVGDSTAVDLMPAPEEAARPRRRMDLDQLREAMLQVSGGIGWTEQRGARSVDLFIELAPTLGKPDYIQVTTEDLDPSALFLKFLDDAARSVCQRTLEADLDLRQPGERIILAHVDADDGWTDAPEAIDANLQHLVRRFHGRALREGAPALHAWRWLFQSVEFVTGDPLDGWMAVCVGLYTHPDFYSY